MIQAEDSLNGCACAIFAIGQPPISSHPFRKSFHNQLPLKDKGKYSTKARIACISWGRNEAMLVFLSGSFVWGMMQGGFFHCVVLYHNSLVSASLLGASQLSCDPSEFMHGNICRQQMIRERCPSERRPSTPCAVWCRRRPPHHPPDVTSNSDNMSNLYEHDNLTSAPITPTYFCEQLMHPGQVSILSGVRYMHTTLSRRKRHYERHSRPYIGHVTCREHQENHTYPRKSQVSGL